MIPLIFQPEGSSGIIIHVKGGRGLVRRLAELGLTQGTRIKVLKETGYGPMLIEVRGSRLAIGRGVAAKIFVDVDNGGS